MTTSRRKRKGPGAADLLLRGSELLIVRTAHEADRYKMADLLSQASVIAKRMGLEMFGKELAWTSENVDDYSFVCGKCGKFLPPGPDYCGGDFCLEGAEVARIEGEVHVGRKQA